MSDHIHVLITGVSSGIGHGLAQAYLRQGTSVFGVSRREPGDLVGRSPFHFRSVDLRDHAATQQTLTDLLADVQQLEIVVLNAGMLTTFGDMADRSLAELKDAMEVNLWANKTILDSVFDTVSRVKQVVAMSSGAAVSGNRGWNGYSLSKAALNMLVQLYARENPDTHFFSLAPGLVDTAMQEYLCSLPTDDRFPTLEPMRTKRGTAEMPTPEMLADRLIDAFERIRLDAESGGFGRINQFVS
jgi:NAD(P)-dependent dehydrogenase (short-subunit alcohol dehydrogenase family)